MRSENGEIRITTDHPELPALSIPLLVRVRSLVDVLPPRISVAHVAGSAPSVARVTLRHGALKRFHVTDAKVLGAPGVSARVISEQPAAMQVIEITLPDGALASGAHAAELVVSTNSRNDSPRSVSRSRFE
ncbi:MAG: hypothetical protein HC882_05260 [Acidobacteria bacterium]|nr:hypothetical protein [Acidobacteriota bacterium]